MATELGLGTVHVFNSESSYNTNKTNVKSNDIALVKIDNLAISGYVSSGGVKLQPIHIDDNKMTLIMDTPQGRGDIVLQRAYTSFDGLYVIANTDNRDGLWGFFISSAEISRRISIAKQNNNSWMFFNGIIWWSLYTSSTTTTFKTYDENCYIEKIYGVTF